MLNSRIIASAVLLVLMSEQGVMYMEFLEAKIDQTDVPGEDEHIKFF